MARSGQTDVGSSDVVQTGLTCFLLYSDTTKYISEGNLLVTDIKAALSLSAAEQAVYTILTYYRLIRLILCDFVTLKATPFTLERIS